MLRQISYTEQVNTYEKSLPKRAVDAKTVRKCLDAVAIQLNLVCNRFACLHENDKRPNRINCTLNESAKRNDFMNKYKRMHVHREMDLSTAPLKLTATNLRRSLPLSRSLAVKDTIRM